LIVFKQLIFIYLILKKVNCAKYNYTLKKEKKKKKKRDFKTLCIWEEPKTN